MSLAPSLRALGGQLGAQWERERRDTFFLMGAIALAMLSHLPHLPFWVSAVFGGLFLWRLGLVLSGRWLPRRSIRLAASAACMLGVYASYGTLIGREPGVALLVLFLGLKLMEMHARRDLFVVIFLCFFLLITAFFYSQTPWTAAVVFAAVVALLASMITMQYGPEEAPLGRRFRLVAILLAQAMPIALILFALFPRISSPLWGLPGEGLGSRTGLSELMTPGSVAQLTQSDDIAFRVRFDGPTPSRSELYWRGPIFGHFDGRTWRAPVYDAGPPPGPQVRAPQASVPLRYSVTLEPHGRQWLFALDALATVPEIGGGPAAVTPELVLLAPRKIEARTRYEVASHPYYRLGLNETNASLYSWLQLPAGTNPRTTELASRWRHEEPDHERLVARALDLFANGEFSYTLRPPLLVTRHTVDEFLFGSRAGFCEHYAAAFVVLMRTLGIPARVVTGYQGGEQNPLDGFWTVRQSDAHAWSEVWLRDKGWTRVDPTAVIAPERIERGARSMQPAFGGAIAAFGDSALMRTLQFGLDALGNAWNQWVLSYDRSRQARLLAGLGWSIEQWGSVIATMAAMIAIAIGVVALLLLMPRRPRDPLERCFLTLCAKLTRAGVLRAPHETALALAARAERVLEDDERRSLWRIVERYNRLRYDAVHPSRQQIRALQSMVRAFDP